MASVDPTRSGVDLRILGPLLVTNGDRVAHVTSRRLRVFLAALTVNVGRPVLMPELVDAIWGDAQPEYPRRVVHVCARRVRAHLQEIGAAGVVVTCPDGYRLDVAPEHTDLGRVELLLREAERASGDLESELALVSTALDQWRGEPLADIPSEAMQREVAPRLREQQMQLAERRIDILLRLGRHSDAVDELVPLTAQHPLRERLWGQLMEALHGSGRRVDALNAYHTLRRSLADELGLDPSEPIRTLHATILTDQPKDSGGVPPVPRELPLDIAAFSGRTAELSKLDGWAAGLDAGSGPVVVVVTGTAGVGKTTLATHWARHAADEFPDGQLFVNMRGYSPKQALSPGQALARFLRALGVRGEDVPADVDERAAMYRSLTDGRRILVVIDNANTAEQVLPLLPGAVGCLVLVTSRDQLLGLVASDGAHPLPLDLLSRADAVEMLARRLGGNRLASEPQAVDDMVAASARLPLALAIVAARAATNPTAPLRALAARLRDGLDAFDTASPATDVRSVFSWSYRELSPPAARLFRLLGLHPGPDVAAPAVASLGDVPLWDAGRLLDELVRAHLVTDSEPGRYTFHDLLRAYASELAHREDPAAERERAMRRTLDHYLHTGHRAAMILNPQRTEVVLPAVESGAVPERLTAYDDAMRWFGAEREVLLAVLGWAADAGLGAATWQLAWVLAGFLERQGYWEQWARSQRVAATAAARLGDGVLEAHAHRQLGRACARQAQADGAHRHYRRALELYRDNAHLGGQARTETNLALLLEQQGRYEPALEHALRALELQQRLGDDGVGRANALNTVAWCHALLGRHDLAVRYCRQAIAEHEAIRDLDGLAATLDTLGYAHHHLGNYGEAVASYRRAIDLYRKLGDEYYTSISLVHLGETHESLGDHASARDAWRQAEAILDGLRHPAVHQVRDKLRGAVTGTSAMTR